jgi:Icc protein
MEKTQNHLPAQAPVASGHATISENNSSAANIGATNEGSADAGPRNDGIDRRNFLSCMAWAGTGLLWTMAGGVPTSRLFAATPSGGQAPSSHGGFSFVQISDSHIGFNKPANQDVTATLKIALDKINAFPGKPDLLLHTGDITHSSKPGEFDTAQQMIKAVKAGETFYVPGEHDIATDDGAQYLERFGKGTKGKGWYSFTHKGVHFIGLNNCQQVDAMGKLGADQLAWLKADLAQLSASTPIVIFAHIPLWMVYPEWGWGTPDAAGGAGLAQALRFRYGAEWAHSPGGAKGRGQRRVSHRDIDGVSAARAGFCAARGAHGDSRRAS